jgi:hypothetical protein
VIIDTPAADRSTAAVTLAAQVDASVMVVAADGADARAPAALKQAIETHWRPDRRPGVQPRPPHPALPRAAAVVTPSRRPAWPSRPPEPGPFRTATPSRTSSSTCSPARCCCSCRRPCLGRCSILCSWRTARRGCASSGCPSMA